MREVSNPFVSTRSLMEISLSKDRLQQLTAQRTNLHQEIVSDFLQRAEIFQDAPCLSQPRQSSRGPRNPADDLKTILCRAQMKATFASLESHGKMGIHNPRN